VLAVVDLGGQSGQGTARLSPGTDDRSTHLAIAQPLPVPPAAPTPSVGAAERKRTSDSGIHLGFWDLNA
jgi:hypothetical protein